MRAEKVQRCFLFEPCHVLYFPVHDRAPYPIGRKQQQDVSVRALGIDLKKIKPVSIGHHFNYFTEWNALDRQFPYQFFDSGYEIVLSQDLLPIERSDAANSFLAVPPCRACVPCALCRQQPREQQ
jgi:hypothetical protein